MLDPKTTLALLTSRNDIPFRAERLPTSARLVREDGPDMHYLTWPGDGTPVVLLHGGALTAHSWDMVCMALGGTRCITPDLRGHGESGWADEYRIESGVSDLIALVDALSIERFHLVGMSLGGNIAGHAAARLGPRLMSLTMVDIAPGVSRNGTSVMREFLSTADARESIEALIAAAHALSPRTDLDLLRYRYHYMTETTREGWRFRQDRRKAPDFPHIMAKLAALDGMVDSFLCPLLVVCGARSRVLGEAAARAFASRARNGRQVTIPDAGHNVQEDHPRALADALRAHFAASESWTSAR